MRLRLLPWTAVVAFVFLGCTTPPPEPELPQHRRWSARIGQGAAPRHEEDFRRLAAAGYRVVLSVDGAPTDVETAKQHGLAYRHVPLGYDGIGADEALAIVKAVVSADGPVYVHCHHGRHRGPAATALARIALEGVPPRRALSDLLRTLSPAYPGLRADVQSFRPPAPEALAEAPLPPARVRPTELVEHMLEVAERWEHLQGARAHDWRGDPAHPDVDPPHEARLLVEALTESGRLRAAAWEQLGEPFPDLLAESIGAAAGLEGALRAGRRAEAERAADRVAESCRACHDSLRNGTRLKR